MVKNVYGQSGHGNLKLPLFQEWADRINWFFEWCYKFMKDKKLFQWFLGRCGQIWTWAWTWFELIFYMLPCIFHFYLLGIHWSFSWVSFRSFWFLRLLFILLFMLCYYFESNLSWYCLWKCCLKKTCNVFLSWVFCVFILCFVRAIFPKKILSNVGRLEKKI